MRPTLSKTKRLLLWRPRPQLRMNRCLANNSLHLIGQARVDCSLIGFGLVSSQRRERTPKLTPLGLELAILIMLEVSIVYIIFRSVYLDVLVREYLVYAPVLLLCLRSIWSCTCIQIFLTMSIKKPLRLIFVAPVY